MSKLPKVVVAALIQKNNKFLLTKELIEDGVEHWLVPGGKVDFGETLEEALSREIKEEIGVDLTNIQFLKVHEAIFPQFDYHSVIFFYSAKPAGEVGQLESGKVLEARFFSKAELKNLELVSSARWLLQQLGLV